MRYVQSCSRVPERDVPVITGILCESPAAEALARLQLDIEVRCVITSTPSILGLHGRVREPEEAALARSVRATGKNRLVACAAARETFGELIRDGEIIDTGLLEVLDETGRHIIKLSWSA